MAEGPVSSCAFVPRRSALSMAALRPAHGCGSGALLGRFGVLLQALLALCAFSILMREYRGMLGGGLASPCPAGTGFAFAGLWPALLGRVWVAVY